MTGFKLGIPRLNHCLTELISLFQLSPKKTMEGFIGGGVVTVFLGTLFSHWLSLKPSMFCGVEMCQGAFLAVKDCQPSPLFEPHQIEVSNN